MARLLTNLGDNLAQGIQKIKGKYGHGNKKCEQCSVKYKDYECFLEYVNVESVHVVTRITKKKFDEDLKKWFANTYKFSNHDIKKFLLLLRIGVYPYEYMDQREKFNETQLPEKRRFL